MNAITTVATGFSFTEGPCIDDSGVLHVVELAGRCVSRVVDGTRVPLAVLGGSPNGAAFADDGTLWIANGGGNFGPNPSTNGLFGLGNAGSYIQQVTPDGWSRTVLAEIDARRLHSPNDLCFDAEGGLWFTDPVWPPRHEGGVPDPTRVSPGDVCYLGPDGSARRAHTGLLFPNGIAVTPAGDALVVDETVTGIVHRFPITGPGELALPETYAALPPGTDGMCFDSAGRLLVAGHGSHQVFVVAPGGGTIERTLDFLCPEVSNVCFGGPDLKTLFVTLAAAGEVVAVTWDVPGHPLRTRV